MSERICRTCGQSKPETPEYFYRAGEGKLNRQCRDCRAEWAAAYRSANREKVIQQGQAAERRALDVGNQPCSVDGCDNPAYRRPQYYCGAHYARFRKYGDPLGKPVSWAKDLTGLRFGMLLVLGRADLIHWNVECDCGAVKKVRSADLQRGKTRACGNHLRSESVTYGGIHQRVKRDHGVPSLHQCVDCGKQAADWSYDHRDPAPLFSEEGLIYSASVEHYQPRCKSCHKRFDLAHAGGGQLGSNSGPDQSSPSPDR